MGAGLSVDADLCMDAGLGVNAGLSVDAGLSVNADLVWMLASVWVLTSCERWPLCFKRYETQIQRLMHAECTWLWGVNGKGKIRLRF